MKVSDGGEATFYAVREGSVQHRGSVGRAGVGGQGRGKREEMVTRKFEHPPA